VKIHYSDCTIAMATLNFDPWPRPFECDTDSQGEPACQISRWMNISFKSYSLGTKTQQTKCFTWTTRKVGKRDKVCNGTGSMAVTGSRDIAGCDQLIESRGVTFHSTQNGSVLKCSPTQAPWPVLKKLNKTYLKHWSEKIFASVLLK